MTRNPRVVVFFISSDPSDADTESGKSIIESSLGERHISFTFVVGGLPSIRLGDETRIPSTHDHVGGRSLSLSPREIDRTKHGGGPSESATNRVIASRVHGCGLLLYLKNVLASNIFEYASHGKAGTHQLPVAKDSEYGLRDRKPAWI